MSSWISSNVKSMQIKEDSYGKSFSVAVLFNAYICYAIHLMYNIKYIILQTIYYILV